jgi:hypothetical protein
MYLTLWVVLMYLMPDEIMTPGLERSRFSDSRETSSQIPSLIIGIRENSQIVDGVIARALSSTRDSLKPGTRPSRE